MSTKWWKEEPPWLRFTEGMKPGGSRRVDDSFKISFNGLSYHFFDFRNKISEAYKPMLTLAERLELAKLKHETEQAALQSTEPPKQCQLHPRDWPASARIWFYENNLNDDDLRRLGYCWSGEMARVIMPFTTLAGLQSFIARDPWWTRATKGPKYLRPPRNPGSGLVAYNDGVVLPSRAVVLTEDLVSAQRIHDVTGVSVVPLMGTSLSRNDATRVSQRFDNVMLWLDPDGAGGMGQMAVRKMLNTFDLPIQGFDRYGGVDKVDPKKLPDDVISDVIGGWLYG